LANIADRAKFCVAITRDFVAHLFAALLTVFNRGMVFHGLSLNLFLTEFF